MPLKKTKPYFLFVRDAVLRLKPKESTNKNAANHLILGDYIKYLGKTKGDWVKVRSRGNNGWLKEEWLTEDRLLEVNFVDIGQGDGCHIVTPKDEIILIDAGEGIGFDGKGGDNMARFLNWRYNVRKRKVVGVDGVKSSTVGAKKPIDIDYCIMSHPDLDHYFGFWNIFKNKKYKIKKIGHNGIVERPIPNAIDKKTWLYDLGRKVPPKSGRGTFHLWDTVLTDKEMHSLIDANTDTGKFYLKTLVAAKKNNKKVAFKFLDQSQGHLDSFKGNNPLKLEILAPITETVPFEGKERECLIKLGNEGETKNGHSIVFQLYYGKLKMMLGGDLNTKSQDYIAQFYSKETTKLSKLEKDIAKYREKLTKPDLSDEDKDELEQDLDEAKKLMELIISRTKRKFGTDIAKACHHGASDVLDSFLYAINPIATVISSGDNESHSHPRPDALGAFGKSSRGKRPLIFSTELARSANEFSYPVRFYNLLKRIEQARDAATTKKDKAHYQNRMDNLRESNIAKYGMITVRTDGKRVIIAQKLEKKRSNGQKWDIYDLHWNDKLKEFEYNPSESNH